MLVVCSPLVWLFSIVANRIYLPMGGEVDSQFWRLFFFFDSSDLVTPLTWSDREAQYVRVFADGVNLVRRE